MIEFCHHTTDERQPAEDVRSLAQVVGHRTSGVVLASRDGDPPNERREASGVGRDRPEPTMEAGSRVRIEASPVEKWRSVETPYRAVRRGGRGLHR